MFFSFWSPFKDQIPEETEKATGGSNIGERKWTEWAKTEEAHSLISPTICQSDRNKQKLCLLSDRRMRLSATVQRWFCLNVTLSTSLWILANIRWEVKYFAQTAQIRIKGISPKQHSSAAEVFHDQLRKLQLALKHSVSMGFYSCPLYLTHFQWSISLYEDANKRNLCLLKRGWLFFLYIYLIFS